MDDPRVQALIRERDRKLELFAFSDFEVCGGEERFHPDIVEAMKAFQPGTSIFESLIFGEKQSKPQPLRDTNKVPVPLTVSNTKSSATTTPNATPKGTMPSK